jgi:hypothetical protein
MDVRQLNHVQVFILLKNRQLNPVQVFMEATVTKASKVNIDVRQSCTGIHSTQEPSKVNMDVREFNLLQVFMVLIKRQQGHVMKYVLDWRGHDISGLF